MIGSIAGDIIGSPFEGKGADSDFPLFSPASHFSDDTVLSAGTSFAILTGKDYALTYREFCRRYPNAGYGGMFNQWLRSENPVPYNSFGNGSAMRVSPVGFAFDTLEEVLLQAKQSAECTHSHPEGIKGSQATASAIFLARMGKSKQEIKKYIADTFHYDLNRSAESLRKKVLFMDETCQNTVPQAIIGFLESKDFEDAIRIAATLSIDVDTICCITGGIAQAYYGVPKDIADEAKRRLTPDLLQVVEEFERRYNLL